MKPPTAKNLSLYLLTRDYEERVYAGVLGKIIGVYLGRPFEGWSNADIESKLGEVNYYVHEQLNVPLIVTDDDISGTFTFIRALTENGSNSDLTAEQIGDWWLNTIIENRTILWWGGLGVSTEHTAYLRLKDGLRAPHSGSAASNGRTVAEQIGAQIFIDGWGMVCPGDPAKAAGFARRAASVSHDGEAIFGAQIVAALEAAAFTEPDLEKLLDTAAGLIPRDSLIFRLIADMREWAARHGDNWRATLHCLREKYGYDKYGGGCHIVPNHAVILLALLHGEDDFQRSLMIANTAGYDTDCNSGNVGCLLGIKNSLAGINAGLDWRGPLADRLYLPTADGARCITDAVREAYELVNTARAMAGHPPAFPKNRARFHFSLPGSLQGFHAESSPEVRGTVTVDNTGGCLILRLQRLAAGRAARVATATFAPPEALAMSGYSMAAVPTLYSGQTVKASVAAGSDLSGPVTLGLYLRVYSRDDTLVIERGPQHALIPGQALTLEWTVPDTGGRPIAEVGLEATAAQVVAGTLRLDTLTWAGTPSVTFRPPDCGGKAWQQAWVNAADEPQFRSLPAQFCRLVNNHGTGLLLTGEWSWTDYTVSAQVIPHLARRVGLAGAVRGLRRYVALVLTAGGSMQLIAQQDGTCRLLAETEAAWTCEKPQEMSLTIRPGRVVGGCGEITLEAARPGFAGTGAIGLLVDEGNAEFGPVTVAPAA